MKEALAWGACYVLAVLIIGWLIVYFSPIEPDDE